MASTIKGSDVFHLLHTAILSTAQISHTTVLPNCRTVIGDQIRSSASGKPEHQASWCLIIFVRRECMINTLSVSGQR
jgi:hypothetical protein